MEQAITEAPGMEQEAAEAPVTEGSGDGFSIDARQVESSIREQMDKDQQSKLDRVLKAGHELLFGKETHYQLIDSLTDSQDIGGEMGKGAFDMTLLLLQQSGNTLPGEIVIPAGVILLARVCEFLNESGIAPVTDDDFDEAVHVFTTLTMHRFDPDFKNRMQQMGNPEQPDQEQVPSDQEQSQVPQQGGLLDMTGRGAV